MGRIPRISQCMIVRNEEENIKNALSWGKNIMWEQIVVDTGSIDKTAEIAGLMGAKVSRYTWNDDFAAAKNYAISQAGGDWIAFLDADEYLAAGDDQKLYRLVELAGDCYDAISTGWMQLGQHGEIYLAGTQIRIFRNIPGLRYRRRIHEQLGFTDGHPMRVGDAVGELAICHTGYCGEAFQSKNSSGRNLKLIEKELADHPDDYEMLGYLGDEYYHQEDFDRAAMCYERSAAGMPAAVSEHDQRSAVTYARLMLIRSEQQDGGRPERIKALYEIAAAKMPKDADFDYILGCHYAGQREYRTGIQYLERALGKLAQHGYTNRSMMTAANQEQISENLIVCYYYLSWFEKAADAAALLLRTSPYNFKAVYFWLKSLQKQEADRQPGSSGKAFDFLDKMYDFNSLKDRVFLLRAAREASDQALSGKLEGMICAAEWDQLGKLGIERRS